MTLQPDKLMNCPLCGKDASFMIEGYNDKYPNHSRHKIWCPHCGCTSWPSHSEEEAAIKWNNRNKHSTVE